MDPKKPVALTFEKFPPGKKNKYKTIVLTDIVGFLLSLCD